MQKIQTGLSYTSLSQEQAVAPKTAGKAIRVLLIGGDQREAFLIRKKLARTRIGAFSFEYTDKLSAGLERLAMGGINVLLLDPGVPDGRRLESITRVRARYAGIPIIILSAQDSEKEKAEALKKGAQDYLPKGKATIEVLIGSVQRALNNRQQLSTKVEQKPAGPEAEEFHFASIINNNPDGIIIIDRQGKVCFANPAVESLFGCKAKRLMGESLDSLVAVNGGKTEIGIVRTDGVKRTAEVSVVEIKYRGDTAYLASLRDITERKQVEEDTRKALLEAESTRANAVAEAIQAKEEAKRTKVETETARAALDNLVREIRRTRGKAKEKKSSHLKLSKASQDAGPTMEEVEALKKSTAEELIKAREEADAMNAALAKVTKESGQASEEVEAMKKSWDKELAKAKEEARLAREEAETVKATLAKVTEEAGLAGEEVEAMKKSSAKDLAKAREETEMLKAALTKMTEEASLAREEAEATTTASAKAIARAEKETKAARDEAEATRTASLEAIDQANKDAKAACEEFEESKTISAEAVSRANNEARIAREEAEAAKSALTKMREEARLTKEEADEIKTASAKEVAKVNREIRLAREETEDIKKACAKAIAKSSEEARAAREEAKEAKAVIAKSREETKMFRQEAEETRIASTMAISRANEEARIAKEEAAAARAESEAVISKMPDTLYNLDPMQSEFMSNIIHELRSPLHSILAFTKLLYEGDVSDTETQQEFYKIITDQSELLRKLIDELIDISPIESERFNLHLENTAMTGLIRSCVHDCYGLAKLKNISITENIPKELPEAEVDIQRFTQLMFNLLGNAIKFSYENGNIVVGADAGDNKLTVIITDHGIGIPAEVMPSLFEKYFQVKSTDRVGGLGLGLYLSKRIVEAHGGEIRAESKEGSGSTFSFTIPLKQDNR